MKRIFSFLNNLTSLWGRAHPMLARFFRYFLTASSFSGLDLVLLLLFVDFIHIFYLEAAAFSFIIANSLHYFVARKWGFKGTDRSHGESYVTFIGLGALSLGLTLYFMELLVDDFGWHYLLAKITVAIVLGAMNFFAHYYLTFRLHLKHKK